MKLKSHLLLLSIVGTAASVSTNTIKSQLEKFRIHDHLLETVQYEEGHEHDHNFFD